MVTARSPGGTYNRFPDVPDKPNESASFSHRLDIILRNAIKINEISGTFILCICRIEMLLFYSTPGVHDAIFHPRVSEGHIYRS
jgi:hypothetical protein